MDLTAIISLGVTVVLAVGGSSWHLASKLALLQASVTNAIHEIDKRLTRIEAQPSAALKAEALGERVVELERVVDNVKMRCEYCKESR